MGERKPKHVFICDRCMIWRIRVSAPHCKCGGGVCREVPDFMLNEQMKHYLAKANSHDHA